MVDDTLKKVKRLLHDADYLENLQEPHQQARTAKIKTAIEGLYETLTTRELITVVTWLYANIVDLGFGDLLEKQIEIMLSLRELLGPKEDKT